MQKKNVLFHQDNAPRHKFMKKTFLVIPETYWVMRHLSHARYLSRTLQPAQILSDVFLKKDYIPVIDSNSDED